MFYFKNIFIKDDVLYGISTKILFLYPAFKYLFCKLLQCVELNEQLFCISMEIKWYKYIRKVLVIR